MKLVQDIAKQMQEDINMDEVVRIATPIVKWVTIGLIAVSNVFILIPTILVIVRFFADKAKRATFGFAIVFLILHGLDFASKLYLLPKGGEYLFVFILGIVGLVAPIVYIFGHCLDRRPKENKKEEIKNEPVEQKNEDVQTETK